MRTEESRAMDRMVGAKDQGRKVTKQQCYAELRSWESKGSTLSGQQKDYWTYQLSTEELIKLSTEAIYCESLLKSEASLKMQMRLADHGVLFSTELLSRAENIIIDQQLVHEYLMRGSK
jgi:hypothetical protein